MSEQRPDGAQSGSDPLERLRGLSGRRGRRSGAGNEQPAPAEAGEAVPTPQPPGALPAPQAPATQQSPPTPGAVPMPLPGLPVPSSRRGGRSAGAPGGSNGATAAADWELFLLRLRYRESRTVQVASNHPIVMDDPQAAWIVYSGRVDLFAAPLAPDGSPGPRRYLFSAESGDLLFGVVGDDRSSGLLVSGVPGTQLLRTTMSGLERLAKAPEFRPLVARLLDGWIVRLSGALIHELPPRTFTTLVAGTPVTVAAGTVVRCRSGVVWVGTDGDDGSDDARYLGLPLPSDLERPARFPLAPAAWITTPRRTDLAVTGTIEMLADGTVWPELGRLHRLAHLILADEESRLQRAEADRRAAAAAADDATFAASLAGLTAVLEAGGRGARLPAVERDPLLAACRLVGDAQGLRIVSPAGRAADLDGDLASIARASRLRTRSVTLRGAWWRGDHGPLVGYRAESGAPVALVGEERGYVLIDAATGERQTVDGAVAATLNPRADSFYRRFASGTLSTRDLLLFGLRGCRADLLRVFLVAVGVGLLALAGPVATGLLFDVVIPGAHLGLLVQVGVGLALAALVAGAFEVVREVALLRLGARFQAALEPAIMDRVLNLPGHFFRDYTAGDHAARTLAVSAIRDALTGPVLAALFACIFSGFSLLMLFWYAPRLAVVAVLLLVPLTAVFIISTVRLVRLQRHMADVAGRLSSLVLQLLQGIAKLRGAGAEQRAFAQWAATFAEQRRDAYAMRAIVNRQAIFTASFPVLSLLVLFAIVAGASDGPRSVGTFVAFIAAFAQFVAGALTLLQSSSTLVQVWPAYERARPLLDAPPEVDDAREDPGELSGAIDVDHVTFRYAPDGSAILDDVSISCQPGEFIALVGPSGSGKSTLLRLLLGFEQATSGAIFYDGRDLATLDVRLVRRQIGSVLQNSRLLPGDIASNIIGASSLTLDDAWDAARLAGFAEDVEQMPMGMHTVIGEGSDTLSGGQRQRLAIARAIVHRPRILIFDEATSALDNRTQELVSASLRDLAATRIVVAHRLSTVVNADRIYVLRQGRVVEQGTYRELMQRRGVFAEMARRQIV